MEQPSSLDQKFKEQKIFVYIQPKQKSLKNYLNQ